MSMNRPANRRVQPQQTRKRRRKKKRVRVMSYLAPVLVALVAALVCRVFLFDVIRTTGASMETTLSAGDAAIVTKFDYWIGGPGRGDVVCFTLPSGDLSFQRVVGLPGETVDIRDGEVYINDVRLDEPYVTQRDDLSFVAVTIPANRYLVLSDNRPVGSDSRSDAVGLVAKSQLIGKARLVVMPLNHLGAVN